MANEKRLISYDVLIEQLDSCIEHSKGLVKSVCVAVRCFVERMPTAEAVEVVRCENCQYWNPRYETMGMCMKHNSIVTFTKPDFFCAWGKDKNDGICKED